MAAPLTTRIPIKNQSGEFIGEKEVATYAGLLARAHDEGLSVIRTEMVQIPTDGNGGMAIVTAQVTTHKGTFTGIGDACAGNVNRRIAPHLVRMAETRAKARALRDAVNIGIVALDELGDESDEPFDGRPVGGADNVTRLPSRTARVPSGVMDMGAPQRTTSGSAPTPQNAPVGGNGAANPGHAAASNASGSGYAGSPTGSGFIRATEPQRRLLFRLVAEEGYDGEGSEVELCRRANVGTVAEISKAKASAMIEAMKNGRNNGAGHA